MEEGGGGEGRGAAGKVGLIKPNNMEIADQMVVKFYSLPIEKLFITFFARKERTLLNGVRCQPPPTNTPPPPPILYFNM